MADTISGCGIQVATSSICQRRPGRSDPKFRCQPHQNLSNGLFPRITSYNVCYTKLLREGEEGVVSPVGDPAVGEDEGRALAVTFDDGTGGAASLTYGELDRRANQLARHLLRLGAAPEGRVAICMYRSLELVVAMLGVLKAGLAFA